MLTTKSLTFLVLLCLPVPVMASTDFAGGDGSSDAPWQINSAEQLALVQNDLDAHYILTADIDLGTSPWNQGAGWEPIGSNCGATFNGQFDGAYHTISGLVINRPDRYFVGLFGCTNNATIRNINIESATVTGWSTVGGLVGNLVDGTVIDSSFSGTVMAVRNIIQAQGGIDTGGLIGHARDSVIIDSFAAAEVSAHDSAGGLVGHLQGGQVSNSHARSTVSVTSTSGTADAGGLIGQSRFGRIINSYADSTVDGEGEIGAVVGDNYVGTLINSFWNSDTEPDLPGLGYSIAGGAVITVTGKTEAELQTLTTFTDAGWNFDTIWSLPVSAMPAPQWLLNPVSTPPLVFPLLDDQQVKIHTMVSISIAGSFIDPDGGNLNFSASGLPDGLSIDEDTGIISGTTETLGNSNVTVTATDPENHTVSDTFSLVIDPLFDGSGTSEDPWQVSTVDQLNAIRFSLSGHFILTEDINLDTAPWNEDAGWDPIGTAETPFKGTLDGNEKTISGLVTVQDDNGRVGFFGEISGAAISDLTLAQVDVQGSSFTGGLAAYIWNSQISNTSVTGSVRRESDDDILPGPTGGMAGYVGGSTIINSHFSGTVTGLSNTGGLVGTAANSSEINQSSAQGSVAGTSNVGGLAGSIVSSTAIQTSFARSDVEADFGAGGLAGYVDTGSILDSFALIHVAGGDTVAGLVGRLHSESVISNSYARGSVAGNNHIAGLAAEISESTVRNSYVVTTVTGNLEVAALVTQLTDANISDTFWSADHTPALPAFIEQNGSNSLSNTQGISTGSLQTKDTYPEAEWDFETKWEIAVEGGYPFHIWSGEQAFNLAPVSNGIADQEHPIATDFSFDLSAYFTDPDKDNLSYQVENLPAGFTLTGSVISGSSRQIDSFELIARVTDPEDLSVQTEFTLTLIPFSQGDGSSETPWEISLPEQLDAIRENLTAHYRLSADIDLDTAPWNQDSGWAPIGTELTPFSGSIDGNGYALNGIHINDQDNSFSGLFGYARNAGFSNLSLQGVSIHGGSNTGGLVGHADTSTITNSHVQGSVIGTNNTGGLAGIASDTVISGSHVRIVLEGDNFAAGLAGLVSANSEVSDSYVLGEISGTNGVAGFVARSENSRIENSYVVAHVAGNSAIAGFVAEADNTEIVNSLWSANLMPGLEAVAASENDSNTESLNAVTVQQMRQPETFTVLGWDFATLWNIAESGSYPFHRWSGQEAFNTPPVSSAEIPTQQLRANSAFSLNITPYLPDVDADALLFESSNLPAGLSLHPTTGVISGSTTELGSHLVTVSAKDASSIPATSSFTLDVITFTSGDGSADSPWSISSASQLDELRAYQDAHAYLTGDINLGGNDPASDFYNGGLGWLPIGTSDTPFTGSLDGKGHVLSGLFIDRDDADTGLFGFATGAAFSNLLLEQVDITGSQQVGAITGYLEAGSISHSYVSGTLAGGDSTGGLAGAVLNSQISFSVTSVNIQSEVAAGGLLGELAGTGTLENSYALGTVNGLSAGGLIGMLNEGSISNSYAAVTVSGNSAGGLLGARTNGSLSGAYWLLDLNPALSGVGTGSSDGTTSMDSAAMRVSSSFTGWDFDSAWQQAGLFNNGFPYLQWTADFVPRQYLPELSTIDVLGPVVESETLSITHAALLTASNTTDQDGSIEAFAVTALSNGELHIGEQAYDPESNFLITADKTADWTSVWELTGDSIAAFSVKAVDNDGLYSSTSVIVQVEVTEMPNREPVVAAAIPDQLINSGTGLSLDITAVFTDPDDDELTLGASGLPNGLTLSPEGILSGTVLASGVHTITLTATDPELANVESSFSLTVVSFDQGDGSIASPWQITSAAQLAEIALVPSAHYMLTSDLDLGGNDPDEQFWNDGSGWQPIGTEANPFTGTFDGQYHQISNLYINRPGMQDIGLFGRISHSSLRNLILESAVITGDQYVGGLAGYSQNDSSIENSSVNGELSGISFTGGLIGNSEMSSITASHASGSISGINAVAGLVGFSSGDDISSSFFVGEVTGDFSGGIAGMFVLGGNLENSYAIAVVTPVAASFSGGLVGYSDGSHLESSFWHAEAGTGLSAAGLDAGTSNAVRALTDDEMKDAETFTEAGWDFQDEWAAYSAFNDGYPHLQWMYTPPAPEPASPPVVDSQQQNVSLTGEITVTSEGVINGGQLSGNVSNSGLITGNTVLGSDTVITGGSVAGTISGQPSAPARLDNVTVQPGTSLSNVIITGNTDLASGDIIIGSNVRFATGVEIPSGIDLSNAFNQLQWLSGDQREVIDLAMDIILDQPGEQSLTLIRAIQLLEEFEPSGNDLTQNDSTGEITLLTPDTQSKVLPINIRQAAPEEPEGSFINADGDIVFITANRRVVLSHPVLVDNAVFMQALAERGLQLDYNDRTNLVVSPAPATSQETGVLAQLEDFYFSARPDVSAFPAVHADTPGIAEFPLPGLGSVTGLSVLFEDDDGHLLEQDIVPVPADWFALKQALASMPGFSAVSISTQGIISVQVDGVLFRARTDYTVRRGQSAATTPLLINPAGDLSGNGVTDYEIQYANGDRQYLYLFPAG